MATPDGSVVILSIDGLDNSYTNTLYFSSLDEQLRSYAWYSNADIKVSYKPVLRANDCTYIRKSTQLKVPFNADLLLNDAYNYLLFKNVNIDQGLTNNKVYFAFITDIEFINDNTSAITFEIDVMQTYLFDMDVGKSFVEREHPTNDYIGHYLEPEGLEYGEYELDTVQEMPTFVGNRDNWIVVADSSEGGYGAGTVYSGLKYSNFSRADDATNYILSLVNQGKGDSIAAVFMYPDALSSVNSYGLIPVTNTDTLYINFDQIDSYFPKNNKLYTSPYYFLYLFSVSGGAKEYALEYFYNVSGANLKQNDFAEIDFTLQSFVSPSGVLVYYPNRYKTAEQAGFVNAGLNEIMSMNVTTLCSYNIDTYKAWLAQNAAQINASLTNSKLTRDNANYANNVQSDFSAMRGLTEAGVNLMTLNFSGAASSAMNVAQTEVSQDLNARNIKLQNENTVRSIMARKTDAQAMPTVSRGSISPDAFFGLGMNVLYYCCAGIKKQFAEKIDNFFEIYGYKINLHKIPNIFDTNKTRYLRPYWNYVKTANANVINALPLGVANKIRLILDNGITFWMQSATPYGIGDYNNDNHTNWRWEETVTPG